MGVRFHEPAYAVHEPPAYASFRIAPGSQWEGLEYGHASGRAPHVCSVSRSAEILVQPVTTSDVISTGSGMQWNPALPNFRMNNSMPTFMPQMPMQQYVHQQPAVNNKSTFTSVQSLLI